MGLNKVPYYLPYNACYKLAKVRTPIGIQLHSIGCPQGTAKQIADSMATETGRGVTYVVDADVEGYVLQTLPEDYYTYADAGFGNRNCITIEMGESDHMAYKKNSAEYTITNQTKFKADILRSYRGAVMLCADICKRYKWNPLTTLSNGMYLISSHYEGNVAGVSSNHVDPYHIWSKLGLSMAQFRNDVAAEMGVEIPEEAPATKGIPSSKEAYIKGVAAAAVALYPKTKILPSVVIGQACVETGYGLGTDSVELVKRNNILGMKVDLINNTWKDHTVWKGEEFTKTTPEYEGNILKYKRDRFRVYADYKNCVEDYEQFLLHVQNDAGYKYKMVAGMTDPAKIIHIIRVSGNGTSGYCTDPDYEKKVIDKIADNNLTIYDDMVLNGSAPAAPEPVEIKWYRVGRTWKNGECPDQIEADEFLDNAIKTCNKHPGLVVFDYTGKVVYENNKSKEQQIIDDAIEFAAGVANNDDIGYFNGGYYPEKGFCCISLVVYAFRHGGLELPACNVWDAPSVLLNNGFNDVTSSVDINKGLAGGLLPGDIVWRDRHIELINSDGQLIGARGDFDQKPGDSSGQEIAITPYCNDGWKRVFRLPAPVGKNYRVQTGAFQIKLNAKYRNKMIKEKTKPYTEDKQGYDSFYEKQADGMYHTFCGSFQFKANAIERQQQIYEAINHEFMPEIKEV